jgi:hypothetical protein
MLLNKNKGSGPFRAEPSLLLREEDNHILSHILGEPGLGNPLVFGWKSAQGHTRASTF